jgi:integrase
VRGLRSGENPARWRGHLENLLPKRSLVQKVVHHKAMPYVLLADFMNKLRPQSDISSLALQFLILTATRTNETLNAKWSEINFEEKVWTIPPERMKAKKEHRVPLTDEAVDILKRIPKLNFLEHIFVNSKTNAPLSSHALLQKLSQTSGDYTVHGFRSSFRDWVSEETAHARDVAEAALAHTLKDKVEAAYRRGDFFRKRQALMSDWSFYCSTKSIDSTVTLLTSKNEIRSII